MSKKVIKNKSKPAPQPKAEQKMNAYAKYSAMGIQMAVIITAGALGGVKLDQYLEVEFPYFTFGLTISSVVLAIYLAIKDIIKFNS